MNDLRDLYQDVILDHGKNPRNLRKLVDATCHAHGRNPMCGDDFEIYLKLGQNQLIEDVSFEGQGCAISVASASIMTELLIGKTAEQAQALFRGFQTLCVTGEINEIDLADEDALDHLQVMAGVRQFPIRVKCATLAWHAMNAALEGRETASSDS